MEISAEDMAKAKEDAAELLRIRVAVDPTDTQLDPRAVQIISQTVASGDAHEVFALVIALVQFGWMTADFLIRQAKGHELDRRELDRLIELFQSDTKG